MREADVFTRPRLFQASVGKSLAFGKRRFPSRADYERALEARDVPGIEEAPSVAAGVVRHWHTSGQTGCLFARRLAKEWGDGAWPTCVPEVTALGALSEQGQADALVAVRRAIEDPRIELLSLIFPRVASVVGLKRLCLDLASGGAFEFFEDRQIEGFVRVAGRVSVADGVVAWLMAFGPYDDWPPTRQGPLLELVLRSKPKSGAIDQRLNQDSTVAHLADIDPALEPSGMDRMYDGTLRATKDVLGGVPGELSAARTTFSFPSKVWDAAGPGLPEGQIEPSPHS